MEKVNPLGKTINIHSVARETRQQAICERATKKIKKKRTNIMLWTESKYSKGKTICHPQQV